MDHPSEEKGQRVDAWSTARGGNWVTTPVPRPLYTISVSIHPREVPNVGAHVCDDDSDVFGTLYAARVDWV